MPKDPIAKKKTKPPKEATPLEDHTGGTWVVERPHPELPGKVVTLIPAASGPGIRVCLAHVPGMGPAANGNAHLMARAPTYREALRQILAACRSSDDFRSQLAQEVAKCAQDALGDHGG